MPSSLDNLRLDEVLDWAGEALDRVDRASFFATFGRDHAVQYFYEPFLEAFDPQLRKELGVWYTPPEIVRYMVARVDTVLREELDIPDGLADPRVVVLDPCCGTGAYLVEVLRRIAQTLQEKGGDALVANDLKRAAIERVYGFEILPAPFVISHLQVGLALKDFGAPLSDESNERAGIYLTNALTGWDPPKEPKQHLLFPEMEEERDKAAAVKQHAPILVILGNPPYNGFAGVSPEEEAGLLDAYKQGLAEWGVTKHYLDDLYVRFFRVAERRIGEMGTSGVVCFISNDSWTSGPSYVTARQHLLRSFDRFWLENMHGDRTQSEYAPDGRTSETIFALPGLSAGIRQGVVVSLWVKSRQRGSDAPVRFRDDLTAADANERRHDLLLSLDDLGAVEHYVPLTPTAASRFSFRPYTVTTEYPHWPRVPDLASSSCLLGLNENRGETLVDEDRDTLVRRMRQYFDPARSLEALPDELAGLRTTWARFDPQRTRSELIKGGFDESRVVRFLAKPFDLKWAYVDTRAKLWNESRSSLVQHSTRENRYIMARCRAPKSLDGAAFCVSRCLTDQHALHKDAYLVPLILLPHRSAQTDLLQQSVESRANLSGAAIRYLSTIGLDEALGDTARAEAVWLHCLASGYAPAYLAENADGLRLDWPRIPLPATREALLASAELGRQVAALLDVEEPVAGVSTGSIRYELRPIGPITAADTARQLDPAAGHLAATAGWGHAGKGGITMPGKGKLVERPYTLAEQALLREGAGSLGMTYDQLLTCLGETCHDVYLNDHAYWRCVPARVWKYTIGGYQVMKKWLSYREHPLLGRDLKPDEARYVSEMARRIAAILLLEPALDANYEWVKADTYPWPGGQT